MTRRACFAGRLTFKGGFMDGAMLSAEQVDTIAKLPSRDVLNAQLVGTIAAPLTGLARTLNALIQGVAIQLGQIRDQGLVAGTSAPADGGLRNCERRPPQLRMRRPPQLLRRPPRLRLGAPSPPPQLRMPASADGTPESARRHPQPLTGRAEPAAPGEARAAEPRPPDRCRGGR